MFSIRSKGDDLLSRIVQAEVEGERLKDEEVASFLWLLVPAWTETPVAFAARETTEILLRVEEIVHDSGGDETRLRRSAP